MFAVRYLAVLAPETAVVCANMFDCEKDLQVRTVGGDRAKVWVSYLQPFRWYNTHLNLITGVFDTR